MSKQNLYNKRWIEKQKRLGLCIFCKEKKLKYSFLCKKHFFIQIATSTLKNRKMAHQIEELFYAQKEKCYLTGKKLILGRNTSLDHIVPQSKTPKLKDEISNLRWCTKEVNKLKNNFDYDGLIKLCKNVVKYNNKLVESTYDK